MEAGYIFSQIFESLEGLPHSAQCTMTPVLQLSSNALLCGPTGSLLAFDSRVSGVEQPT